MQTKAPKAEPKAWKDGLEREDYAILEKVISYGKAMNRLGKRYSYVAAMVENGSLDITPYAAKLQRPKTLEEGHVILKAGLREAYAVNPIGLVEVCAGGGKKMNLISGLQADYGPNVPRDEIAIAFALSLVDRYALKRSNPKIHLLGGSQTLEVARMDDKKLAPSSNAIEYWDPSQSGVWAWINGYMKQPLKSEVMQYLTSEAEMNGIKFCSLDAGKDQGIEPVQNADGSRGFVRQRTKEVSEGSHGTEKEEVDETGVEVESVEEVDDLEKGLAEIDRRRNHEKRSARATEGGGIDQDDDDRDLDALDNEELEEDTLMRDALDAPAFVPTKPFDPNDLHREDLVYVVKVMRANQMDPNDILGAVTGDLRQFELKKSAVQIVDSCSSLPEHTDMKEIIRDWPVGKRPLFEWMPELFLQLEKSNMKIESDEPRAVSIAKITEALSQQEFGFADPQRSPEERIFDARAAVEEQRMWRMHASPEGLEAGDRIDYRFLARKTNSQVAPSSNPEEFDAQMKKMGARFLATAFEAPGMEEVASGLNDAMKAWDPMRNYFSEAVCATIREMSLNNTIAQAEPQISGMDASGQDSAEIKAEMAAVNRTHRIRADLEQPESIFEPEAPAKRKKTKTTKADAPELPGM